MDNYINQLIEEIREATTHVKPPHEFRNDADPDDETDFEDMSHVEKYIYGDEIPVSAITGIDADMLPPPEKLSYKQQALLTVELEKLLNSKHFALDFPQSFPADRRYPFIRKFWSENHVEMSVGTSHIEFCSYEKESCPFPGYCTTCDEIDEQFRKDEEIGKPKRDLNDSDDPDMPF